jgi:transposase
MVVIVADTHQRSHTVAAVEAAGGRVLAERTVSARRRSFDALLAWARGHGERVWAIEDCRHVSGALEQFLLARGETVVRVAPKLTAAYLARRQADGKTRREAIRCLKRHLARRVWHLLQPDSATTIPTSTPTRRTRSVTIHCNTLTGSLKLT